MAKLRGETERFLTFFYNMVEAHEKASEIDSQFIANILDDVKIGGEDYDCYAELGRLFKRTELGLREISKSRHENMRKSHRREL